MEETEIIKNVKTLILPRDAAGHKMTSKVPVILSGSKIAEARALIEEKASYFESINYLYIVSKSGKLKGVVSIKDLFRFNPETTINEVMATNIIKAHPETDQEKVANLALQNNIKAIPLVDKKGILKGVLTSGAFLSILEQESKEDMLKMSGIIPLRDLHLDSVNTPILKSVSSRLPWLIIGLLGGIFAAKIIGRFEHTLEQNIILAFFIPLIVYISDAVGTQTQTLIIRDLAVSRNFPILVYSIKQSLICFLIGIACGLITFAIVLFMWSDISSALAVGLSTSIAIFSSVIVSLATTYTLFSLKQDPAIGTGPFATIIQDLLSVVIYLSVASLII